MLGRALKGLPRDQIFVTSKCGRYDEAEFDFSPDRIRRSVKESLQRLQLEYLDLVHCHDIEFVDINQVTMLSSFKCRKSRNAHLLLEQDRVACTGRTGGANK